MNRVRKVHKEVRGMQFEEVKIMQTETFKLGGKVVYLILNEQVQLIMYAITLIMYCREYVYDLPNKMCAIFQFYVTIVRLVALSKYIIAGHILTAEATTHLTHE
jgi:hypothetical protein